MSDVVHIYTLTDPRDGVVRYVGQTKNPKLRMKNHRSKQSSAAMEAWLAELRAAGLEPVLTVVRSVPAVQGDIAEHSMLRKHLKTAFNVRPAGNGQRWGKRKKVPNCVHVVRLSGATNSRLASLAKQEGYAGTEEAIIAAIELWMEQKASRGLTSDAGKQAWK